MATRSIAELIASRPPTPPPPTRGSDDRLIPLTAGSLRPAEAVYQTWHAVVPPQYVLEDACEPDFWRTVHLHIVGNRRPAIGDFVRLVSASGAFDVVCTIEAVDRGYTLRFHHGRLPEQDAP
jgi:hypothetical protein